jgi:hypothetical protein
MTAQEIRPQAVTTPPRPSLLRRVIGLVVLVAACWRVLLTVLPSASGDPVLVSLSPGRRRDGQVPRRGPDHVRPACPRGARDGPDDESPQASTSCQPGRTTHRRPTTRLPCRCGRPATRGSTRSSGRCRPAPSSRWSGRRPSRCSPRRGSPRSPGSSSTATRSSSRCTRWPRSAARPGRSCGRLLAAFASARRSPAVREPTSGVGSDPSRRTAPLGVGVFQRQRSFLVRLRPQCGARTDWTRYLQDECAARESAGDGAAFRPL